MDNKKHEDLQSRREFFKSAAKAALPVLGAVALASSPIIAKAAAGCDGCWNYCSGGCKDNCDNACKDYCTSCSGD